MCYLVTKLKPYPVTKYPGVAWAWEVPTHWNVKRLKYISHFLYGDSLASSIRETGQVPVYGSNGSVGSHIVANTRSPCIVVGRKGSFGKVNFCDNPVFAIDTTFFVDDSATSENIRWLFYALGWLRLDAVSKDSAVPGLNREDAYKQLVPTPPPPEQAAIARYLDYVDRRVQRLIQAKRKLVALLAEQKQAIIHHAVTRGLDPDVPMKGSGVEWLGEVPKHWQMRRLKYVSHLFYGGSLASDVREDGDIPVYGSNGQVGSHIVANTRSPCIVIGRKGSFGKVNFCDNPIFAIDTTFFIDNRATSENICWLFYMLGWLRLDAISKDAAIPGLSRSDAYERLVPTPPLPEQTAIANYLDQTTTKIDITITRTKRQIELLTEYRTRLISDVVTGKLDVREAAAALPETDPLAAEDTPTAPPKAAA